MSVITDIDKWYQQRYKQRIYGWVSGTLRVIPEQGGRLRRRG
jgi:hypothetical protein